MIIGSGLASGFMQLFASIVSIAFIVLGIYVTVLIVKFLMKANTALDLWIRNNSSRNSSNSSNNDNNFS